MKWQLPTHGSNSAACVITNIVLFSICLINCKKLLFGMRYCHSIPNLCFIGKVFLKK